MFLHGIPGLELNQIERMGAGARLDEVGQAAPPVSRYFAEDKEDPGFPGGYFAQVTGSAGILRNFSRPCL